MSDTFLSALNWRHAAKEFKPNKQVPQEEVDKIIESIQMTPSSFGLQPYHILVVTDDSMKQQIQEAAWNQPQVGTSSHLLVFCSRNDIGEHRIDEYMELLSNGDEEKRKNLEMFENMMREFFKGKSTADQKTWADRQTYIALGFAMAACAELHIDSCPMEGFTPSKVDEILELPENLKSVVLLPIGYRADDPERPKVRFPEKDLFETK